MATIGNSNVEASAVEWNSGFQPYMNTKAANTYTAASGDQVDALYIYLSNGNTGAQTLEIGVYDITSGANGAALVASLVVDPGANTAAWYGGAITPVALTPGNLYAVACSAPTSNTNYFRSTAAGNDYSFETAATNLSTACNPWAQAASGSNRLYSLYANVTNTPSGVTPEIVVPWAQRIVRHSGRFM